METNWLPSWSKEDMQAMQEADPGIAQLLEWKREGRRPSRQDLLEHAPEVRTYCAMWNFLLIHDNLLYRKWSPKYSDTPVLQLVLPHAQEPLCSNICMTIRVEVVIQVPTRQDKRSVSGTFGQLVVLTSPDGLKVVKLVHRQSPVLDSALE